MGSSRPAVVACHTVRSGVFYHWIHHLRPQGAVPPGFNPLRRGWVYRPAPEAPRKGGMPTGSEEFLELPVVLGFGPATGLTIKTALCHIRTLVGRRINHRLVLCVWVEFITRRLRRPEKGNADGVRGIFGTACRVGLRPCDRTHLKNGLVPHSYAGEA